MSYVKHETMDQERTQPKTKHHSTLVAYGSETSSKYRISVNDVSTDVRFHARTLFLFTYDQILDTVIPGTAFGVFAALSGPILDLPSQCPSCILCRIPSIASWLWFVILQFCVQNQRSSGSVVEDSINKPWRPIPSGRMMSEQTDKLLAVANIVTSALSYQFNVVPTFVVYVCLITAYNDYGAGNKFGIIRNLFCGAGFLCYFSGALSIAIGSDVAMSSAAWNWAAIITLGILMTTIQSQEFRDEAGDKACGRRTLVTELGRKLALWTVFMTVAFWSVYTPLVLFPGGWKTAFLPVVFGGALLVISFQAYHKSDNKLDRKMYMIWCLWMFGFCPLPFFASILS